MLTGCMHCSGYDNIVSLQVSSVKLELSLWRTFLCCLWLDALYWRLVIQHQAFLSRRFSVIQIQNVSRENIVIYLSLLNINTRVYVKASTNKQKKYFLQQLKYKRKIIPRRWLTLLQSIPTRFRCKCLFKINETWIFQTTANIFLY